MKVKFSKLIVVASLLFAMVFTLFACSSDSNNATTEPSSNSGSSLCAGEEYDSNIFRCEAGELIGKCAGKDYYSAYQNCVNGVVEDKVGVSSSTTGSAGSSSSAGEAGTSSSSSVPSSSSSKIVCESHLLGMGYDVIRSAYINNDEVKKTNPILDQDKLCQAGVLKFDPITEGNFYLTTDSSITKLYKGRNDQLNVGANFFVGGVNAKFATEKQEEVNNQVYYAQLMSYNYKKEDWINTPTQNLSQYLTDEFINDLKSKTPEQILSQYGTHTFIRYKKGGYLEANYTYYGTKFAGREKVDKAIEASYKVVSGGVSVGTEEKIEEESASTSFNYKTYGGTLLSATTFAQLTKSAYSNWISSLNNANNIQIAGIGNFDQSLIPVWTLATAAGETAKATALQNAFNQLVQTEGMKFPKGRMFETKIIIPPSTSGYGLGTNYSVGGGCPECTYVEMEIYVLGAGGGGQGGNGTYYEDCTLLLFCDLVSYTGTGGAGGGGAATYARLSNLGLTKGQPVILDSIVIGKGGVFGTAINQKISGQHSGGNGGRGGDSKVVYKGARILAKGGFPGGGVSPTTPGGTGGTGSNSDLPTNKVGTTSIPRYMGDGKIANGSAGTPGDWQISKLSTGGKAASITNTGTVTTFGGGLGGERPLSGSIRQAEKGGGGSGGYSINNGREGGHGLVTIVLKYYKEEDKPSTVSSGNITTSTNPSLLWDLSMGFGISTGGGWYGYDDQTANDGYSSILFRDVTDNAYRPMNDVAEWDGGANFSLDPSGFEYAYAGIGFAWKEGGAIAADVWGSHTGVCLEYSLTGGGDFYMKIATGGFTEDNEFKVPLPKQTSMAKRLFRFDEFQQGLGWGIIRTLAGAKQNSIGMQIQGEAPLATIENGYNGYITTQTGTLTLKSISWDSCN
ncbi:MAG: hypothetical protein LBU89_11155 [Fibromonadaceae bacterium]|nr:hypothetical protein [Fibromonadaceae bacterium]